MKNSKKLILIVSVVLVATILVATLAGCLKIGMKEKNLLAHIEEEGGTHAVARTTPITIDGEGTHNFESKYLVTFKMGEEGAEEEQTCYVIYCGDDKSADWAKEKADEYIAKMREEQAEIMRKIEADELIAEETEVVDYNHWVSYQYDRVVICGYYKVVSILRSY